MNYDKTIIVRINRKLHSKLVERAKESRIKISQLVRNMLESALKN